MKKARILASLKTESGSGKRTMAWYTGASVYRYDFWADREFMLTMSMDPKAVDLSRMAGAPLLMDHWRSVDSVAGVIEKAWIENGVGMAEYRLSDTPDVELVAQKIDQGILKHVSMEAVITDMEDTTPKGGKLKEFTATKWYPEAVAIVPVGADPDAVLMEAAKTEGLWLPTGLYQPHKFESASGAARSTNNNLLAALLQYCG